MDDYIDKWTFLYEYDIYYVFSRAIETTLVLFVIMRVVFDIGRLLHVFNRLCLPVPVHPKLSDILPSPVCELDYPLVAIQLPMMNEIECCESVIECACNLDWPKSRLVVQVLDDSSDNKAKTLIGKCVRKWADRGIQINVYRRPNREGFKAGSMIYGMSFLHDVEYIAIFDVDFLPTKDYLLRVLPSLIHDPTVAFVQARWTFTNSKETLLTRMQEISLNFHHKCEQEARFRASLFFGFNGTGGIWRTSAIKQSGGWHTDTLVEDLDLSFRTYSNGWRSVYMHDVECLSELPPTVTGYLCQQHRWMSGTAQVAKKLAITICQSRHRSLREKLYCLWYLFRSFSSFFNLILLVVIMPLSIWIPQPDIYNIVYIWLPIITNLCYIMFTFDEIHLIILNNLFLHAMSLNNACASLSGLFNYGAAKKWIVTPKFGSESKDICHTTKSIKKDLLTSKRNKNIIKTSHQKNINKWYSDRLLFSTWSISSCYQWTYRQIRKIFRPNRLHKRYFGMAIYLLAISYLAFEKRKYFTGIYIFAISMTCFILAFGVMGRQTE